MITHLKELLLCLAKKQYILKYNLIAKDNIALALKPLWAHAKIINRSVHVQFHVVLNLFPITSKPYFYKRIFCYYQEPTNNKVRLFSSFSFSSVCYP